MELSRDEPETITASLCSDRCRLKLMLFLAIVLPRRIDGLFMPMLVKSFSLLTCSFWIDLRVVFVVIVVPETRIELRIFDCRASEAFVGRGMITAGRLIEARMMLQF